MNVLRSTYAAYLTIVFMALSACSGGEGAPDTSTPGTASSLVADAGRDQSVFAGSFVTLNGSKSTNANQTGLTYTWTLEKLPGSNAALSNPNIVNPAMTVDIEGTYTATLVVTDAQNPSLVSAPDTVLVVASKTNPPPAANAGDDKSVFVGRVVTLNGSGSSDANNDPLKFNWSFTRVEDGSAAMLADRTTVAPSFTPDKAGNYVIQLVVNDGTNDSTPDLVTITASPKPLPTADAGPDQFLAPNTQNVTLNGSGSQTNPSTDPPELDYAWTINSSTGFTVTLKDSDKPTSTFDIPANTAGTVIAQLTVTDKSNPDVTRNSSSDTVMITVQPGTTTLTLSPKNPPNVCSTVTLSGTSTSGALNPYNWSLTPPDGSSSVLNVPTDATPTFKADKQAQYTVRLKVVVNGVPGDDATITFTPEPNPDGKLIFMTDGLTPIKACGSVGCHAVSFFDSKSVGNIKAAIQATPNKMGGPTTLSGTDLEDKIGALKNYLDSTKPTCP